MMFRSYSNTSKYFLRDYVTIAKVIILVTINDNANTPNANMADHSVSARDELHESEGRETSVFCIDNGSPEKSCFVDGPVCLISLCLQVLCS